MTAATRGTGDWPDAHSLYFVQEVITKEEQANSTCYGGWKKGWTIHHFKIGIDKRCYFIHNNKLAMLKYSNSREETSFNWELIFILSVN